MMIKKEISKCRTAVRLAVILSLCAAALLFAANTVSAGVTDGYLEYKEDYAGLKWAVKLGDGWQSSPTPPTVHGDYIYCAKTTQVVKMDKETGRIVKTAEISAGQKFTIIPVKYIEADKDNGLKEDIIVVPLYNGQVQVFDADDLSAGYKTKGSSAAKNGIQLTTNIACDNGYMYFGTWYGDEHSGYFYCYRIGETAPLWTVEHKGGFYLSDPYIDEKYIYFGSDSGVRSNSEGKSKLYVCRKGENCGSGVDSPVVYQADMQGNCRAAVVSEGSSIFAVTQAGKAYKFDKKNDATCEKVCEADLGAPSTGPATIYKGVIYYCLGDSTIVSLRTADLSQISKWKTPGYVQGGVSVSNAKEKEEGLYIYGSYNKEPAGLFAARAKVTGEFESMIGLFTPPASMRQYNMTPITLDGGRIYYRNDSGNIMALESGYTLWTEAESGGTIDAGLPAKAGSTHRFNITAKDGYKCADIIVDGKSSPGAGSYTFENVSAPHEIKAVFIQEKAPKITAVAQSRYDSLSVKWEKATGAAAYELYRGGSAKGPFSKIAAVNGCSYTDAGLMTGKMYYYKVKGIYKRGSAAAETASSSPKGGETMLSRTTLKVSAKKGKKAQVRWKKVAGATGYEIYRAKKKAGKYKRVAKIKKGTTLKWINKKLKKGKKYYYKVIAIRKTDGGTARSAFSNICCIKAKM